MSPESSMLTSGFFTTEPSEKSGTEAWVVQLIRNLPVNTGDANSIPGSGKFPWSGKGQPAPVFLPGKFHGQRGPWGCKELDTTEGTCTIFFVGRF